MKVQRIIHEMGYTPNPADRVLQKQGKKYRIEAILVEVDALPFLKAGIEQGGGFRYPGRHHHHPRRQWIENGRATDYSPDKLVARMIGREITNVFPKDTTVQIGDVIFEVKELTQEKADGGRFRNISFQLRAGEILDEPTRGIDVDAKSEIHKLMTKFAREGMGIIMISSELPEVLGMSDRVVVMQEGIIQGTLDRSEATQESIMKLAARGVGKQ